MKSFRNFRRATAFGFSVIEILMVVAVMSSITAGAVFTLSNVIRASENTKLQRDVNVVNSAIRTYLMNGGTFIQSDLGSPATVLAKLKKRATAQSARELAGLKNSMADERLTFEMQTSEEANRGGERARFIADLRNPRFVIERSGPPGIRRFVMDAGLAGKDFGTEERKVSLKLATKDPWVWDYTEGANRRAVPGQPPAFDVGVTNPAPPDPANILLNPPDFSLPTSTTPLLTFPKSLTLIPTNPPGTSQILYSINGSPYRYYAGPFPVDPGMTVTAVSISLDQDHYDDSSSSSRTYSTTPITPEAVMLFAKSSYNYFELGGQPAPGTPPPSPSGSVTGSGFILNIFLIPLTYQNSSVFRYVWSVDGSNPLTSTTASQQPDFTGGFFSTPIPLPIEAFGKAASVTVTSAVKAVNKAIVTDSVLTTRSIGAAALALGNPLISIDGRDVTLSMDLSTRDVPKDVRIYYTTDGTDPGVDASGNPVRGQPYAGLPFTLTGVTGSNLSVRARAYPPVAFPQFFTASAQTITNLILPAETSVYVGGNFVNSGGSLMRNIAKLNNSGQVDIRFDTGSGAAEDSLVGVVRQIGGGIMAGGDFDTLNGSPRPGIVRLNPNGSVDAGFDADLTTN